MALLPCLLVSIGGLWLAASSMAIFNIRAAVPFMEQTYGSDQQTKNAAGTVLINLPGDDRHQNTYSCFTFLFRQRACTFLDPQTNIRSISGSLQGRDSLSRKPHQHRH